VKAGLKAPKIHGLRLAILSNGAPRMLEAAARSAGIFDLLDRVLSVQEVQIFKPSPHVYSLAPQRLNVTRAELGFVSSNSWDVGGAAAARLRTVWIQRTATEPPGFTADRVVRTITELASLVRA
jgi:2-haloacid dehalogenase